MKRYRIESWGMSVHVGAIQVGAAVNCLPFELTGGTHWPWWAAKVGTTFTAEEFIYSL